MKRNYTTFLRAILIGAGVVLFVPQVSAEVETLINFGELVPDTPADAPRDDTGTLLKFTDLYPTSVGVAISDAERDSLQVSLALPEWTIKFSADGRYPAALRTSGIRVAQVNANANDYAGEQVMGVRVNFPENNEEAHAYIEPPYRIPRINLAFSDGRQTSYDGLGLLQDVAQLRSISVNVYGLNYQYELYVMLEDTDGVLREYPMGFLDHVGWDTLTWENPYYEADGVGTDPNAPLYPVSLANIVFRGFRVSRLQPYVEGKDFVAYFRDVTVDYDPTIFDTGDIDNEGLWDIVNLREQRRRQREYIRGGSDLFYKRLKEQGRLVGDIKSIE